MKRVCVFFSVALLTFTTSVAITWAFNRVVAFIFPERSVSLQATDALLNGKLAVAFLRTTQDEFGKYAQFEVTNGGPETAYYTGYSKNSHCSNMFRQGLEIKPGNWCFCGTGLEQQALKPRETAKFSVRIPNVYEPFEVGFDFRLGQSRMKQTVWSSMIQPSGVPLPDH